MNEDARMFSIKNRKAFWVQTAVGLVLLIGGALLVRAIYASLVARGITSGFGFLDRSTGWDVAFSLIPYTVSDSYGRVILVGLLNTMFMGAIGLFFATLFGIVIGTMRISANPVISFMGTCYVEAMRNIPLILQVIFWYSIYIHLPPPRQAAQVLGMVMLSARGIFVPGLNVASSAAILALALIVCGVLAAAILASLPRKTLAARVNLPRLARISLLLGVVAAMTALFIGREPGLPLFQVAQLQGLNFKGGIRVSPEFAALLTGISLYGGAFVGEIVRAGFLSVGHGQIEAAQALGLSPAQVLTKVRLPLAVRMALPTLTNQYVWLLKATTLGIAVGFSDLFMVISTSINQSGQTLELIAILMASFLVLNNSLAAVMNFINRRVALRGTQIRL
jgi:general L-amino acid transport system permease protein